MNIIKKIAIFLITLIICAGGYIAVRLYNKPVVIEVGKNYTIVEVEPEENNPTSVEEEAGELIDGTQIGETESSDFKLLDENDNVVSRFGFKKLLHRDGLRWKIEEPYMTMFGDGYLCRVNSLEGTITVEMVAGKPVPVLAELSKNVKVEILAKRQDNITVSLDSLSYQIDRNRLVSKSNVSFRSDSLDIDGVGLELSYEPNTNLINYLRIDKVDLITLYEIATEESKGGQGDDVIPAQNKGNPTDLSELYELVLNNDVHLETDGNKIDADSIRINNILWKKRATADKQEPVQASGQKDFDYWNPKSEVGKDKPEELNDIKRTLKLTARCSKSLEFKPIGQKRFDGKMIIDLVGSPLRIVAGELKASCPYLWYDSSDKLMKMLQGTAGGEIMFESSDGKSRLITNNSIIYRENDSIAKIEGPGKLTTGITGDYEGAEFTFEKSLDVFFNQQRQVTHASAMGGVRANLYGEKPVEIIAKNADIGLFENGQPQLIKLTQDVSVKTDQGLVMADRVDVDFQMQGEKSLARLARAIGNASLTPLGEGLSETGSVFASDSIVYTFASGTAVANGGIKLTLSIPQKDNPAGKVPLVITCTDDVVYDSTSSEILFSGDVRGQSTIEKPFHTEITEFTADTLKVLLAKAAHTDSALGALESIDLQGAKVIFENKKFTKSKIISAIKIESKQVFYNASLDQTIATGPGKIEVNNRNVPVEASSGTNSLNLTARCYALVDNFSKLLIDGKKQVITAEKSDRLLRVGYIPVLADGTAQNEKLLDTSKLVMNYAKDSKGQMFISKITASGGVNYFEPDKYSLIGDKLNYDASSGKVHITGTDTTPCVVNNNVVSEINYNMNTGDFKTTISGISSSK